MQYGDGVKKNFLKQRIPTIIQKDRDVSLAPSTISIFNNGKVQYRGEKMIQDGIGFFSTAEFLQQNPGIGGRLRRKLIMSS